MLKQKGSTRFYTRSDNPPKGELDLDEEVEKLAGEGFIIRSIIVTKWNTMGGHSRAVKAIIITGKPD